MTKSKLLGQVFTPEIIAIKMIKIIKDNIKFKEIKLLDPCIGPATFLKALNTVDNNNKNSYFGFDIDPEMINYSQEYSKKVSFNVYLESSNYLLEERLNIQPNAIIMNPPYIRHEWIEKQLKEKYKKIIEKIYNTKIDGRSNLFVYFFLKSFSELVEDGLLCILVYDAILSTTYGKKALDLILNESEIIYNDHIKTPFNDVLVDASLLVFKKQSKKKIPTIYKTKSSTNNLIPLEKLLHSKRGIGLINSKLFLAEIKQKYFKYSKQFIKKQLSSSLKITKEEIKQNAYIFEENDLVDSNFLEWFTEYAQKFCNEKSNTSTLSNKIALNGNWYRHKIHTAPILFNYYIRNNPRFIRNIDNSPFSDNFYGIYPYDVENDFAWLLLNTPTYIEYVMKSSRNQGNGLEKIQLHEFRKVLIPNWNLLVDQDKKLLERLAKNLKQTENPKPILLQANKIIETFLKRK